MKLSKEPSGWRERYRGFPKALRDAWERKLNTIPDDNDDDEEAT